MSTFGKKWDYVIDFKPFWPDWNDDVKPEEIPAIAAKCAKAIRRSLAFRNAELTDELDRIAEEFEALSEVDESEHSDPYLIDEFDGIYGSLCDLGDWYKRIWIAVH